MRHAPLREAYERTARSIGDALDFFESLSGKRVHEATRVGSMEARVGTTKVPDHRLGELARIFEPPKVTHATVEYLDFPAISKEALRDPSYLASMRVADALAHVLRLFESDVVPHENRPGVARIERLRFGGDVVLDAESGQLRRSRDIFAVGI